MSYGLPPHPLVPLVILGCARGDGHATGFHQPLPKETPYLCLLGVPDGRWSEALNRDHHSCKALQSLVKKAFLSAGLQDVFSVTCAMSSTSASGPTVFGIARMIRWSIATISTTSGHAALVSAMKAALRLKRNRSKGIQFLYHRFLEVAYLDSPVQVRAIRPTRPQTANLADAMKAIGGSWITDPRTGARYSDPAALLHAWGCLSTGTTYALVGCDTCDDIGHCSGTCSL